MRSTVEPIGDNKVKLNVEVDEGEVEKAVEDAFRKIGREVNIPGFRPGKAPRRVLEARLGKDVARGQALSDAIPDFYLQAVREHDVDIIASPEIDITDGETEGPVVFEATVQVRPEINLGGYESLRITVPSLEPSDEEIDEQIERLRTSQATYEPVERPAEEGDQVVVDIAGELNGEAAPGLTAQDYAYEVGSGGIVPEVDAQLTGASAGEELSFSAKHPVQEDAELTFEIAVKEVRARVLPDLDDDFAAEVSELDTFEELREDLRERARGVRRSQAASALRERIGESLADLVTEDIPEALIEAEMQERVQDLTMRLQAQGLDLETFLQVQGRDNESFAAELRQTAVRASKVDLALRSVVAAEGIEASEEDLDEEWSRVAERVDTTAEAVREQLERAGQMPAVRSEVSRRKAFDWLVERVEIVDEDGNPVDRAELEEADDAAAASAPPSSPAPSTSGSDDEPEEGDDSE